MNQVDYPVYPIYIESFQGERYIAELRLPTSERRCIYYSPEESISKQAFENFHQAYLEFVNNLLMDKEEKNDSIYQDRVKTAIITCEAQVLASNQAFGSYLNPINWVYGTSLLSSEKINLLRERQQALENEYGKCVLVIFYNDCEKYSEELKNELDNIVIVNRDSINKSNPDQRQIVDLMIYCGLRALPPIFMGIY